MIQSAEIGILLERFRCGLSGPINITDAESGSASTHVAGGLATIDSGFVTPDGSMRSNEHARLKRGVPAGLLVTNPDSAGRRRSGRNMEARESIHYPTALITPSVYQNQFGLSAMPGAAHPDWSTDACGGDDSRDLHSTTGVKEHTSDRIKDRSTNLILDDIQRGGVGGQKSNRGSRSMSSQARSARRLANHEERKLFHKVEQQLRSGLYHEAGQQAQISGDLAFIQSQLQGGMSHTYEQTDSRG